MKTKTRLDKFFDKLKEDGLTNTDIVEGIDNGDIPIPEWLVVSIGINHLTAWDNENAGEYQSGLFMIWCDF